MFYQSFRIYLLIIHLTTMSDSKSQNNQFVILYLTYHTIITYPVSPTAFLICSQTFAKSAGIITSGEMLHNPGLDYSLSVSVQFFELFIEP